MKHFVVEIIYKVSIDKIESTTMEHRSFLRTGYDMKKILLSGPQVPRIGGMLIARGESMEEIVEFFKDDPYQKKGLADYHFIEFHPANYQEFLKDWIEI
ncbi:MAG: YciI family protein [Ignavibacteriales bacterium]|nr:YciI family protein [Ignavibacteriales bacterium]